MSLYNNTLSRHWEWLFVELADRRTNDWFLIRDPAPGLTILAAYLWFCLSWGPRYMQHRKPFQLKRTLVLYNLLQVMLSTYIFFEGLFAAWLTHYSWTCEPVDFSESPRAMRVARGVHIYFLAKMSELLDTVFFVLRKKQRHVSFLHVYHHTVMPMISWGVTKYFPGGHGTFIGVINSGVHIVMYSYYMLAALLPPAAQRRYLWWKRYITTAQLAQFCIAFLHSAQLLWHDCGFPRFSLFFTLPNAIFFYYLFWDFYHKAYGEPASTRPQPRPAVERSAEPPKTD